MKSVEVDVSKTITVSPLHIPVGTELTVYMDRGGNHSIQVELRVTPDGVAEAFCDALEFKSFDDWYLIP